MLGKAFCPASCGEIVQGTIDDYNFLVTCPIALYSQVTVNLSYNIDESICGGNVNAIKTFKAVKKTLKYFNVLDLKADIRINSKIPYGIGLSSSTADITAGCLATAQALGKKITANTIADIALSIEPSDGIMYPGVMLFDHINGRFRKRLGILPKMNVYIINTGEQIDTVQFNNMKDLKLKNRQKEPQVKRALNLVLKAFNENNEELLGKAMKISAIANQSIHRKPHLKDIIKLSEQYDAIGVNIAHSGSIVGIFFKKDHFVSKDFCDGISGIMKLHRLSYNTIKTHTISSGPEVVLTT